MSDRGILFLFSLLMVLVSLAAAVWLAATGQALTMDGLFLTLTCLLVALCFSLYIIFLFRRVRESLQSAAAPQAQKAPAAPAKAPLVTAEKEG
jgi:hypothetical protein